MPTSPKVGIRVCRCLACGIEPLRRVGLYTEAMHPPPRSKREPPAGWGARFEALRNIPPLLKMVWRTSPGLAVATVVLRLIASFLPVATLWVAKLIIDIVVGAVAGKPVDPSRIWVLLTIEFSLRIRFRRTEPGLNLCDSLLGDKFTNFVSIRMMEHASELDLVSFEDPEFYDKMEEPTPDDEPARYGRRTCGHGPADDHACFLIDRDCLVLTLVPGDAGRGRGPGLPG